MLRVRAGYIPAKDLQLYFLQLLLVRSNKCIKIYKSLQQLLLSSEMLKILIFTHTSYIDVTLVFIHELVVRARQLFLCSSVG